MTFYAGEMPSAAPGANERTDFSLVAKMDQCFFTLCSLDPSTNAATNTFAYDSKSSESRLLAKGHTAFLPVLKIAVEEYVKMMYASRFLAEPTLDTQPKLFSEAPEFFECKAESESEEDDRVREEDEPDWG